MTELYRSDEEVEALLERHFGLCGCSEQKPVINLIITALEWARLGPVAERPPYTEVFSHPGVYYVIVGILDRLDFVTHGVSIRCPWITPEGEEFLRRLTSYRNCPFA